VVGLREIPASTREKATNDVIQVVIEMLPAAGHGLSSADYEVLDDSEQTARAIQYWIEDIGIRRRPPRFGAVGPSSGR
jgi:hypothetical protein